MKTTGIVRRLDELGRIVIPIELRRSLNLNERDHVEIYALDDQIVLKKYENVETCYITGKSSENNLTLADGKLTLSEDAAEQLLHELTNHLNNKK